MKDTRKLPLRVLERLFRPFALGDINRHADHTLGLAVPRVFQRTSSDNPTDRAVRPKNPELLSKGLVRLSRFRHGVRDSLPISRVHIPIELLDVPGEGFGLDPKHRR